uniref:Uncharacterized protein n=1 Tax=Anopheles albimanus TaxID=7167 RepID=A0A182FWS1_ANOAL
MEHITRIMLVVCVLLLLGFNARGQESDSNEQHTTEPSVEPQENPEQESVAVDEDGPRRDDGDVTLTEDIDGMLPNVVSIIVAPCMQGYRADHKGKCRPVI